MAVDMIVEDGTVVAGANSYGEVEDCVTYATSRGLTFAAMPEDEAKSALIRATDAMDATYRQRLPGDKVDGRDQSLEWPRTGATDANGDTIEEDEVPDEWVRATFEMAVRERANPGSMMPDLERGGAIRSIRAGSVGIDYGNNASATTVFTKIDGMLSGLLGGVDDSPTVHAVRG